MAFFLGAFLGALIVTFLLSHLFLWLLRRWASEVPRLLVANALSLFAATVVAAFGDANGGEPNFEKSFSQYVLPQLVWLVVGLVRSQRKASVTALAQTPSPNVSTSPPTLEPMALEQASKAMACERVNPAMARMALASAGPNLNIEVGNSSVPRPAPKTLPKTRFNNFIARNWRGEFPLWMSYWVFGFVGNAVAVTIAVIASPAFNPQSGYNPYSVAASIFFIWIGVSAVIVWQLVGVWRSANHYINASKSTAWARLAKIAVLLGAARAVIDFVNVAYPQMYEATKIAFMNDPDTPEYAIRIMRNGTEIEVTGGIKYGLNQDFVRILDAAPQVKVVHLNSDGGRIGEAEKMFRTIRDRGLDTYVSFRCRSACTLIFAAGRQRWLLASARLGYHAPSFPGMDASDLREAVDTWKTLVTETGVDQAFMNRALSVPSSTLWHPTEQELVQARAISGIVDQNRFAASGYGPKVTREVVAERFKKAIPLYAALEEANPTEYAKVTDEFFNGYVAGETEGKLIEIVRVRVIPFVQSYRQYADDATQLEIGRLIVDQLTALRVKDTLLCYEYASGRGGLKNYTLYLSPALVERELAVMERILRTAARRPDVPQKTVDPLWQALGTRVVARLGAARVDLLNQPNPTEVQQRGLCDVFIVMYQEILAMDTAAAAILMRENFRN